MFSDVFVSQLPDERQRGRRSADRFGVAERRQGRRVYMPQKPDGSLGNAINAGWDLKLDAET